MKNKRTRNKLGQFTTESKVSEYGFVNLSTYTSPEIKEIRNKGWVEYGADNDYFQFLIDRYNGSPTNNAAINGISQAIYGKGLNATDSNRKPEEYAQMISLFHKDCVRKLCYDLKLMGQCAMQVIYSKDRSRIAQVEHFPIETLRAEKADEKGEVPAYYYFKDWSKIKPSDKPRRIPAFGKSNENIEIMYVQPYRAGFYYYSPVDYQGGLQYAELEEEISNFHLNNIMNGLSPSMLINFNNGTPNQEERQLIESKIANKFSGTSNAGKFILAFNDNKEASADITPIQLSDAHNQYQFLSDESSKKIMVAHRIVSPMLLGIKDGTGLGNNADEIKTASLLMDNTVIRPFQELLIDSFDKILAYNDIALNLYFTTLQPLEFTEVDSEVQDDETIEEETGVEMENEGYDLKKTKSPCWDGYRQDGYKKGRTGKRVPNCVKIKNDEYAEVGERGGIRKSPKAPKGDTPNPNPKGKGTAKGDASTSKGAKVSKKDEATLQKKSDDFNERYKKKLGYGVTIGQLKSVYQRGLGAFNVSHSPKIKSASAWALARVNAYLYLVKNGRPQNAKYTQDNDLLPSKHPKSSVKNSEDLNLKTIDGEIVYKTKEEAEEAAIKKGCEGYHEHEEDGKIWFMPCESHDEIKRPKLSDDLGHEILNSLQGEKISKEWVEVDVLEEGENISDEDWANICIKEKKSLLRKLADEIYSKNNGSAFSYLDSKNYKIRYKYAVGSRKPMEKGNKSRDFCENMMRLSRDGVVYRLEDIDRASRDGVNKQLGHKGEAYDLFRFKGGIYCRHKWVRVLYRLESNTEPSENLDAYKRTRTIPKSYIKNPRGTKDSMIAPENMPNRGAYPK